MESGSPEPACFRRRILVGGRSATTGQDHSRIRRARHVEPHAPTMVGAAGVALSQWTKVDTPGLRYREATLGRSAVRAVDVDHQGTASHHGHDDLLRSVERIDVTMHEPCGHVEEAAGLDVHRCAATRTELKPRAPD